MPSVQRRFSTGPIGLWLCASIIAAGAAAHAQEAQPAGRIKLATGSATVVRGGQQTPARAGDVIFASDVLRTGADGQIALMLKDESRLSIGPGSELTLSAFAFVPADGELSLVVRMARGVLSYLSGRIAKLMPDAVRLETPSSVIGVRGTHALVQVQAP